MTRSRLNVRAAFLVYLSPALLTLIVLAVVLHVRGLRVIPGPSDDGEDTYHEVMDLIERYYVVDVPREKLIYGAVNGMTGVLDRHSRGYDAAEWREFERSAKGDDVGIGIRFGSLLGRLTILRVVPDSPAARGGLRSGDRFLAVDDTEIRDGADLSFLKGLIEGRPGSLVRFRADNIDGSEARDVEVKRGRYHLSSVQSTKLGATEEILYLRLSSFNDNSAAELKAALMENGGSGSKGIVLDLRDNPGGSLQAAVDIVGAFVANDCVLRSVSREQTRTYYSDRAPLVPETPLVVLTNAGSASASEIVAGALQDMKRALVIGEETYGKGVVQKVFPLQSRAGGVKITTSRWLTPSGRSLERRQLEDGVDVGGIVPDYICPMSRDGQRLLYEWWDRIDMDDNILELAAGDPQWQSLPKGFMDLQLAAATEALEGKFPQRGLVP